eukprot:m.37765 g.37765  ORF g.37765 m.37765 type:complete len:1516 (-) comp5853_c0_seq3:127-4674(-)
MATDTPAYSIVGNYIGIVYSCEQGEARNWKPLAEGYVPIHVLCYADQLRPYKIVASCDKTGTCLEFDIVLETRARRTRPNFLQWHLKGHRLNYGVHFANEQQAQMFQEAIQAGVDAAKNANDLRLKEMVTTHRLTHLNRTGQHTDALQILNDKANRKAGSAMLVVRVFLPDDQTAVVQLPPSSTLQQLLRTVCEKRKLDLNRYGIRNAKDNKLFSTGELATRTIDSIGTNEVTFEDLCQVISESKTKADQMALLASHAASACSDAAEEVFVEVHLIDGGKTMIRQPAQTSMGELLFYIARKRGLDPAEIELSDSPGGRPRSMEGSISQMKSKVVYIIPRRGMGTKPGRRESASTTSSSISTVLGRTDGPSEDAQRVSSLLAEHVSLTDPRFPVLWRQVFEHANLVELVERDVVSRNQIIQIIDKHGDVSKLLAYDSESLQRLFRDVSNLRRNKTIKARQAPPPRNIKKPVELAPRLVPTDQLSPNTHMALRDSGANKQRRRAPPPPQKGDDARPARPAGQPPALFSSMSSHSLSSRMMASLPPSEMDNEAADSDGALGEQDDGDDLDDNEIQAAVHQPSSPLAPRRPSVPAPSFVRAESTASIGMKPAKPSAPPPAMESSKPQRPAGKPPALDKPSRPAGPPPVLSRTASTSSDAPSVRSIAAAAAAKLERAGSTESSAVSDVGRLGSTSSTVSATSDRRGSNASGTTSPARRDSNTSLRSSDDGPLPARSRLGSFGKTLPPPPTPPPAEAPPSSSAPSSAASSPVKAGMFVFGQDSTSSIDVDAIPAIPDIPLRPTKLGSPEKGEAPRKWRRNSSGNLSSESEPSTPAAEGSSTTASGAPAAPRMLSLARADSVDESTDEAFGFGTAHHQPPSSNTGDGGPPKSAPPSPPKPVTADVPKSDGPPAVAPPPPPTTKTVAELRTTMVDIGSPGPNMPPPPPPTTEQQVSDGPPAIPPPTPPGSVSGPPSTSPPRPPTASPTKPAPVQPYLPVQGDALDQAVAVVLRDAPSDFFMQRYEAGQYVLGEPGNTPVPCRLFRGVVKIKVSELGGWSELREIIAQPPKQRRATLVREKSAPATRQASQTSVLSSPSNVEETSATDGRPSVSLKSQNLLAAFQALDDDVDDSVLEMEHPGIEDSSTDMPDEPVLPPPSDLPAPPGEIGALPPPDLDLPPPDWDDLPPPPPVDMDLPPPPEEAMSTTSIRSSIVGTPCSCGAIVPMGMRFCGECGKVAGAPCTSCGAGLLPNAKFCGSCGTPTASGAAPASPLAPPAPPEPPRAPTPVFTPPPPPPLPPSLSKIEIAPGNPGLSASLRRSSIDMLNKVPEQMKARGSQDSRDLLMAAIRGRSVDQLKPVGEVAPKPPDTRDSLLASIRDAANKARLKKVVNEDKPPPVLDARSALLVSLGSLGQGRANLRKVETRESKPLGRMRRLNSMQLSINRVLDSRRSVMDEEQGLNGRQTRLTGTICSQSCRPCNWVQTTTRSGKTEQFVCDSFDESPVLKRLLLCFCFLFSVWTVSL